MKTTRITTLTAAVIMLILIQLTGCAGSDNYETGHEPPTTAGKGPGKRQGPPPGGENDHETKAKQLDFPYAAFLACEGKLAGDKVTYIGKNNESIKASCTEYHDHLVAIPDKMRRQNNHY